MTAEAKIPHEGSDWRAVDIFVFTNGQQHSPPRKYHLTAQELNWWNNVLRFLARSQYGSLNSTVDLYTVEGQKVDGPLELINGAAYVAVKPPDNFIDTGYSKYLLKASRSWEKSQARRSISIEIIKPEDGSTLIAHSNLNIPVSNKKTKDEIVDEIINDPKISDHKVIERPHACLNIHENPQRDSIAVLKHLEKKRISPVQRSSILRKSTTSTASVNRRDSLKSKDVITRNSKGPIRIDEKIVGNNHSRNANKSKIPLKVAVPNAKAKSETDQNENKDLPPILNNANPNILIDVTELEIRNEKQDPTVEYHLKSVDSAIPSIIVPMCGNHISDDDKMNAQDANNKLNKIDEECETNVLSDAGKTVKNVDLTRNTTITPTFDKEFIDQEVVNASQIQKAPNASFRENTDNKYVVINNGDIVNLKLQIEVRNGDAAIRKRSKPEHEKSSTDIPKSEKASQINVDSELAVQNKSLQSIYQSDRMGAHRNSAFVVVKCPCCPEKNFNMTTIDTENSINHDKTYVILLPGLEKIPERCQCHKIEETDKESSPHRQSIFNPVKKSKSAMALEILNPTLDISEITISSVRTTLPNIDGNAITSRNIEYVKIASESKHRVAIFDKEVTAMKYTDKDCSKNDCNENNQCTTSGNITEVLAEMTGCLDKSTQTGVCSLLVEARIHDDGRYSFHLPPLEVLKYYKF